jgi:hypothetical protein
MMRSTIASVFAPFLSITVLHATLVLEVPTSTGVCICSDKRVNLVDSTVHSDRDIKISKISATCGLFITGGDEFFDRITGKITFSLQNVAKKYFTTTACESLVSDEGKERYKNTLVQQFGAYVDAKPPKLRPNTMYEDHQPVFGHVVTFFSSGGKAQVLDFRLNYVNEIHSIVSGNFNDASVLAYGEPYFLSELLSGNNAAYDSYRVEPLLKQVIPKVKANRWKEITTNEAEQFSRRIIELSNMHDTYPGMKPGTVSKVSDCVNMDAEHGFIWLNKPVGGDALQQLYRRATKH